MPPVPSWFHVLLSTLVDAAPDLATSPSALAPDVVADAVSAVVPGCDLAAVVFPVLRSGGRVDRPFAAAATDPTVAALLAAESGSRSGPVRDVGRSRQAVSLYLADALDDPRWPAFGRRLAGTTHEVRALAVLPLHVASRGVLLLASGRPHALDEVTPHLDAVAAPVELFLRLAWAELRTRHVQDARETTRQIALATGVVMATDQVPATTALEQMRTTAQGTGRSLREVATDVLARSDTVRDIG